MQSIPLTRTIDAQLAAVIDAMHDLEPFLPAAGFDEVPVDGEEILVATVVGIAEIEPVLELVEAPDAVLASEQRDGIFEETVTRYSLVGGADGTEVTAATGFALDVAIVGGVLDATVIKRQRRTELAAQLDWLEDVCEPAAS